MKPNVELIIKVRYCLVNVDAEKHIILCDVVTSVVFTHTEIVPSLSELTEDTFELMST